MGGVLLTALDVRAPLLCSLLVVPFVVTLQASLCGQIGSRSSGGKTRGECSRPTGAQGRVREPSCLPHLQVRL